MQNFDISALMGASIGGYTLSKLLYTALIVLCCLLVIRVVGRLMGRVLAKSRLNERLRRYLTGTVRVILYVISFIVVADYLGINMSSLVALLSVGSLGVTLAAEDILGNTAGGLVLLSSRPFVVGDYIEANGTSGTVRELGVNHTKLVTPDGLLVLLPNRELANSKVVNYTALGMRRVTRKVSASYGDPTDTVIKACREAVAAADNVLETPPPEVHLSDYGESSIEYTVFCWARPEHYWQVYYAVGEALRGAFQSHGVEMSYNHLNVHITEKRAE